MPSRIHPTAIVGDLVDLGTDVVVGPFSVLVGPLRIGDGVWIGPHAVLGTPAEYRSAPHPSGWEGDCAGAGVEIGAGTVIREYVTVNQGTQRPTIVGPDCYLLARSHVGHDSVLERTVTLAGGVILGGHTHVWQWSNIGLGTVVHQRCVVGPGAMVGMGSAIRQTVGPFVVAVGNPARTVAINSLGLERRGCDAAAIALLEPVLKARRIARCDVPDAIPSEVRSALIAWVNAQDQPSADVDEPPSTSDPGTSMRAPADIDQGG